METSSLIFAQPVWFAALVIVPIIAALYFWSQKRNDALIARVIAPRLRDQLVGAVSIGRRVLKSLLILAVFVLVAVALARPQMGFIQREIKQRGRDIIVAVDTSRSMLATDVTPTRLARAKLVAQDLLRLVRGDRVGLVAFAGSAFLQAPLTVDYSAVLTSLEELDTTVIPKGGTNIAAAIRTAVEAFGKGEGQTRALVILTDGEELDADGIAAAKKAAELGVRIFTVGIGSDEGSLIPLHTDGGGADFVRDSAGKPVRSRLDETRLKKIAEVGKGFFEPLNADVARSIFEKGILPMELRETGVSTSRQPIERYQWPLGTAVVLLIFWLMLGDRKRQPVIRRTAVTAALVMVSGSLSHAATGLEDYQAGNFDKAMASFEQHLQKTPDSDKLQLNAGDAAYKMGDFGKAVDHFTKALVTEDKKIHEDAAYNLGNALVRRGESAQGREAKKADWKNAIQHYTEALNIDARNKEAKENRDIVKKMLEDLEKEEKQQQQKQDQKDKKDQQQNKDQQQQQQQQQDKQDKQDKQDQNQQQQGQNGEPKDDQKKGGEKKDQPQDQKDRDKKRQDKKDQEKNDQGKKDEEQKKDEQKQGGGQDEEKKDEGGQEMAKNNQPQKNDQGGEKPQPAPQPTPGEKKEGELKAGENGENQKPPKQGEGAAEAEPAEKDGEMSAAQARNLLNSLRSEEGRVQLMKNPENEQTLRDW